MTPQPSIPMRIIYGVGFIFFYIWEVIISNLRVAKDVLSPRPSIDPNIVEIELDGLSASQILALSNLVTMTPGTLSLDVSPDGSQLFVHCMYAADPEKVARDIEEQYKERILRVF